MAAVLLSVFSIVTVLSDLVKSIHQAHMTFAASFTQKRKILCSSPKRSCCNCGQGEKNGAPIWPLQM